MNENEISDSQFGKTLAAMLGGMVVLTGVLIVLANFVGSSTDAKISDVAQEKRDQEIAGRIEPVGQVNIGAVADTATNAAPAAAASAEPVSGQSVYDTVCAACHGAGVAGAPKVGDPGAWEARVSQGTDTLYEHAIKGYQGQAGFMPAKGGNPNLSDDAVKAAVDHMLENSK